jgi:aromatic-L-amino-acid decarboxylase
LDLKIREFGMSGRDDLPLLRVYTSEQSHSSVEKAVLLLDSDKSPWSKVRRTNALKWTPKIGRGD